MKQNYESGRSMVEMLGTLAIIGVLSVGGVMGYSYGMDKYRANETINDVNMRGIDLVRQVAMGQTLSLSEWPTVSKAGYIITDANLSDNGEAYFSISGIPQRVCELVYEGIQNNQTTVVKINEAINGDSSDCKNEDNTLGFFFITNASAGGTKPEDLCKNKTCPEGYSCTHGICVSEEVPGFSSVGALLCETDNACRECQICVKDSYGGYCIKKDNGTQCEGGICQEGNCVAEKACTDHTECGAGFFCDMSITPNKCVKAEFTKVYLDSINEIIYISKRSTWFGDKMFIEQDKLCELNDLSVMTQEHFLSDHFQNAFAEKFGYKDPFLLKEGWCNIGSCSSTSEIGFVICTE